MINVAIICGGRSSEHEISCVSASGIISAIDRSKYLPSLIGITKSGNWVSLPTDTKFEIKDGVLPQIPESAPKIAIDSIKADVIFPILHGPYGEDGTIQGLIDMHAIAFVGAGVLASAIGMDKTTTKSLLKITEFPVGDFVSILDAHWKNNKQEKLDEIKQMGFPVFVKPARAGSSVGISKIKEWAMDGNRQ